MSALLRSVLSQATAVALASSAAIALALLLPQPAHAASALVLQDGSALRAAPKDAAPLLRALQRLEHSAIAALCLQLNGALAQAPERGAEVVQLVAQQLGLGVPAAPWHTQRDAWVALGCDLGLLIGSLGTLAKGMARDAVADEVPAGCLVALAMAKRAPQRVAGLLANDDGWSGQVADAAARAGERVWPLPMPADYRPMLDSDVADLRNISKGRGGGTITAALFLQEFVGEGIPWAHLDIAGPANNPTAPFGYTPKGPSGVMVRLLVRLAERLATRE